MICYYCHQYIKQSAQIVEGLHAQCFATWFEIDNPHPFTDLIARSSDPTIEEFKDITNSFFHGKFRKYSARLGERQYLLKVQQSEVPELPAMEYLCNQIAHALNLNIPKFYLVRLQGKLDTFVVENFIQDYPSANLIHIYRYLQSPQEFSVEGIISILQRKLNRKNYIDDFVDLCLFDALIGNHDRHGRNIGIIELKSHYTLAPFYDNTSYVGIEIPELLGAYLEPRGAIPTKETNEPSIKNYIIEFKRLDLIENVKKFLSKTNLDQFKKIIKESFISPDRQTALLNLITRRYQEALNAIEK